MLKKLVALTLAALMLINPMTAFAVSWGSVVDTLYTQRYYNENGVDATVDDNGNVTVSAGTITDFYTDSRFKSYTFKGSVVIDGQEFEVHVGEADAVLVNIESGVGVQVGKMSISTNSGSIEFNNSAEIKTDEMFVDAGTDGDVVVMNTSSGIIVVEDELGLMAGYEEDDEEAEGPGKATLEFINAGSVTTENLWAWSHEGGSVTIDNDGGTISMEVGEHENPSEDEQPGPGEINMMADGSGNLKLDNTGTINGEATVNMGWENNTPAATGTATVTNDGTINGNVNANLHDDANATVFNKDTVNGEINARGWDTSSVEATNSGTANKLYADVGGDAIVKTTNTVTGTVNEQHSDVHDNGTLYQTNDGKVTEQFTSEVNGGNAYNTNNGTIEGIVGTSVRGEGSAEVINNGTIDNLGVIMDGEDEDGNPVTWPADVSFDANGSGDLNVTNTGTIKTDSVHVNNNGSGTVEFENIKNGDDVGTIELQDGLHFNSNGGSGTSEFINAGSISVDLNTEDNIPNPPEGEDDNVGRLNVGASDGATTEITFINQEGGVVHGQTSAWSDNANADITVKNSGELDGNFWAGANGQTNIDFTNEESGQVNGETSVQANGEGATVSATNNGTLGYIHVDASESGNATLINNGTVTEQMVNTAGSGGTSTAINNNDAAWLWSHAEEGGNVSSVNEGTVGTMGGYTESDGATVSVTNNNVVEGTMDVYVHGDSKVTGVNNGDIGYKMCGFATENGEVTVINNNTIGDGVQNEGVDEAGNPWAPDGLWVGTSGASTGAAVNNGTINGELGIGAIEDASAAATNNGTAETGWVNSYDNGNATMDIGGISGETTVAGDSKVSVIITAPSSDVTGTETIAALIEMSVKQAEGSNVIIEDVYTKTADGELIARYSVTEDGVVTLVEVFPLEEEDDGNGGGFDDPRFWTKERIRHDKEEERKAAEIGGVFGSPFWLKQLYLGYMSLNLRLFSGEDQLLFKESLSWVPDTGKLGEKVLTLKVKTEDTSALTMRLDGSVIEKLEQAGIVTINIVDGAGNLFMEYKVQDLKDARAMYGLTEAEYIVVGAADADVLKIAEDGTVSPIEGEAAEEVADEANKEATEETAEETPAA